MDVSAAAAGEDVIIARAAVDDEVMAVLDVATGDTDLVISIARFHGHMIHDRTAGLVAILCSNTGDDGVVAAVAGDGGRAVEADLVVAVSGGDGVDTISAVDGVAGIAGF